MSTGRPRPARPVPTRLAPELLDIQRKTPETYGTGRLADTCRAGGQEADGTVLTTESEVRDPLDGMIRRCIPALLVVAVTTPLTTVSYLVVRLSLMLVYHRAVARGRFGNLFAPVPTTRSAPPIAAPPAN